ncbi:MAG: DUF3887 domain-containing protein [Bacteroidales bacterium]
MYLKKSSTVVFLLLFFITSAFTQTPSSKRDPKTCTEVAENILKSFENGDFANVPVKFDQRLKEGLTAAKLEASWKDMIKQLGPYNGIQETRSEMFVGSTIIYCVCMFGQWPVDFKTVYNGAGLITGLYFLPHLDPIPARDNMPKTK